MTDPTPMADPSPRPRPPWESPLLVAAIAVLVTSLVAIGAILLSTRDDDGNHAVPPPRPTPSSTTTATDEPAPDPTTEPAPDPTTAPPPAPAFDPALPTATFAVKEARTVEVNGLTFQDGRAAPIDLVEYAVGGEGLPSRFYSGPVGTVIEVPGWGLVAVAECEIIETPGRPIVILHFEVQTSAPLVFASEFPVEPGSLPLTGGLRISIPEKGAADGVAAFTVRSPGAVDPIEVKGPVGTTVDLPGWGSLTIVGGEPDEAGGEGLSVRTVTDFPVFEE